MHKQTNFLFTESMENGLQVLQKHLATSEDPLSNKFMKALDKATSSLKADDFKEGVIQPSSKWGDERDHGSKNWLADRLRSLSLRDFDKLVRKYRLSPYDDMEDQIEELLSDFDEDDIDADLRRFGESKESAEDQASALKEGDSIKEAANPTEVRELLLYADNESKLYRQKQDIIKNILRKMKSGKYDPRLAPKLWMYWVDNAAKMYDKEMGSGVGKVDGIFSKQVRMAAAEQLAKDEYEMIQDGEYDWLKESIQEASLPGRMVKDYERRAEAERKHGGSVEINHRLPYVAVKMSNGDEYFFQEWEAEDLLDQVPDNISPEDYILAMAQGW
jgi:hypothetical protein